MKGVEGTSKWTKIASGAATGALGGEGINTTDMHMMESGVKSDVRAIGSTMKTNVQRLKNL